MKNEPGTEFTGRYLVLSRDPAHNVPHLLASRSGLRLARATDFKGAAVNFGALGGADGVYFEEIGVAVTSSTPEQLRMAARGAGGTASLLVEPERIVYALRTPIPNTAFPRLAPTRAPDIQRNYAMDVDPVWKDPDNFWMKESEATWGLQLTRVVHSPFSGRGVRVAVLDTGLDLEHPDFEGRSVVSESFIEGEKVQDMHRHGTHCIGTALGSLNPPTLPRYGIAHAADIYAGKVLSNKGKGNGGAVLAGINWALTNRCRIVSMSLGSTYQTGDTYSAVYEIMAQRALQAGMLLIAAAGNDSDRPKSIHPVGHPADCPSIMAVGAIDPCREICDFSTRGMRSDGGNIDIVAPGWDIHSSVPMPARYGRLNGTSMAAPHVAGIAALFAEARPNATAKELWSLLTSNARRLELDPADMGAGLVQAPV